MSSKMGNPQFKYVIKMPPNRLQSLSQNQCGYKISSDNGRAEIGHGVMSYLASKHKEKHSSKTYNFSKYANSSLSGDGSVENKNKKFNPKDIDFIDDNDEHNPIQLNENLHIIENDDSAIVVDLNKRKKK